MILNFFAILPQSELYRFKPIQCW